MARDTRRGKTASGAWPESRRRAQAERARRAHEEGKLRGGRTIPTDIGETIREEMHKILRDKNATANAKLRAASRLAQLDGKRVKTPEPDKSPQTLEEVAEAVLSLCLLAVCLGVDLRNEELRLAARDWLGPTFTDEDERALVAANHRNIAEMIESGREPEAQLDYVQSQNVNKMIDGTIPFDIAARTEAIHAERRASRGTVQSFSRS